MSFFYRKSLHPRKKSLPVRKFNYPTGSDVTTETDQVLFEKLIFRPEVMS